MVGAQLLLSLEDLCEADPVGSRPTTSKAPESASSAGPLYFYLFEIFSSHIFYFQRDCLSINNVCVYVFVEPCGTSRSMIKGLMQAVPCYYLLTIRSRTTEEQCLLSPYLLGSLVVSGQLTV